MHTNTQIKYHQTVNFANALGLGNVLTTISDRKIEHGSGSTVDYYTADTCIERSRNMISATDYYPFGFAMDERNFSSSEYRFGFNGMEKDDEFTNSTSHYDFGARIYDSRLGRWLAVDPLLRKYPSFSPYNYVTNCPLLFIDPSGKHNVIYLIDLQDDENSKVDINDVAVQMRENISALQQHTQVVIVSKEEIGNFDNDYLDETDGVALIGDVEVIKEYARDQLEVNHAEVNPGNTGYTGEANNPEVQMEDEKVILVSTTNIEKSGELLNNSTPTEVAAFVGVHGFGHVLGLGDYQDPVSSFMTDGVVQATFGVVSEGKTVSKIFTDGNNLNPLQHYVQALNEKGPKFGAITSSDNYDKNKKEKEQENSDSSTPLNNNKAGTEGTKFTDP